MVNRNGMSERGSEFSFIEQFHIFIKSLSKDSMKSEYNPVSSGYRSYLGGL